MKINYLKYIFIIAAILLIIGIAFAQKSDKTAFRLRIKQDNLILSYQNKPHKLNIRNKIDAGLITDSKILFANRRDDFSYLVIDVIGQSKAKQDDRQCGAGTESNLLWIKLDAAWKIADIKSVRYESCWSPTTSDEGYKIKNNTLTISISDFHRNVDAIVSYNANEPEKGFIIKELAVEKQ